MERISGFEPEDVSSTLTRSATQCPLSEMDITKVYETLVPDSTSGEGANLTAPNTAIACLS